MKRMADVPASVFLSACSRVYLRLILLIGDYHTIMHRGYNPVSMLQEKP